MPLFLLDFSFVFLAKPEELTNPVWFLGTQPEAFCTCDWHVHNSAVCPEGVSDFTTTLYYSCLRLICTLWWHSHDAVKCLLQLLMGFIITALYCVVYLEARVDNTSPRGTNLCPHLHSKVNMRKWHSLRRIWLFMFHLWHTIGFNPAFSCGIKYDLCKMLKCQTVKRSSTQPVRPVNCLLKCVKWWIACVSPLLPTLLTVHICSEAEHEGIQHLTKLKPWLLKPSSLPVLPYLCGNMASSCPRDHK